MTDEKTPEKVRRVEWLTLGEALDMGRFPITHAEVVAFIGTNPTDDEVAAWIKAKIDDYESQGADAPND